MSLSREEIIRMAKDAGAMPIKGEPKQLAIVTNLMIERFASAAYEAGAAAEREACAQVCIKLGTEPMDFMPSQLGVRPEHWECSEVIRARGDK